MGPTPILVNARMTFNLTVASLAHKIHAYLDTTVSLDPSGFNTVARPGFSNVGVSTIVNAFYSYLANFYNPAQSSFGTAVLEHYVSGAWVYSWSMATASVPAGGGNYGPAVVDCYSAKSQDNHNFPMYIPEPLNPTIGKAFSYASLNADQKAFVDAHFNVSGTALSTDPAAWRRSRGGFFSQRWLALVVDTNQKLRRIRHIA